LAFLRSTIEGSPIAQQDQVAARKPVSSDAEILVKMVVSSFAASVLVKYGELFLDYPFQADPSGLVAASIIIISSVYHTSRLAAFSKNPDGAQFAQLF